MSQKNIGGQAVLEGVMLRDGNNGHVATANRLENGSICVTTKQYEKSSDRNKFFKLPIVRGVVSFVESLFVGTKTLIDSAEIVGGEAAKEYEPSKFERFLSEKLKIKLEDVVIGVSVIIGLALAILLFTILPTFITGLLDGFIHSRILLSLIEGLIKVTVFVIYIFVISRQKDIKRVFQYHGAEHKTINCYEADDELTVENVRKHTRIHPRCGTSFMFFVMAVSILLFSLLPWGNKAVRILYKLMLMPVVAGISYEIIKFSAKTKSKIVHWLVAPGLLLQRITTAEPDDTQIEVGIQSLKALIEGEFTCGKKIIGQETEETKENESEATDNGAD